jgi:hypothetical protein
MKLAFLFLMLVCEIISDEKYQELFIAKKTSKYITERSKIRLYFGLDSKKYFYSKPVFFEIDFFENKIIINNDEKCDIENSCFSEDKIIGPEYYSKDKEEYYYVKGKSFLGLKQQKTQIIKADKLNHYVGLDLRVLTADSKLKKNILGMAPNSPIWAYWNEIYNFHNNIIYFNMSLNPSVNMVSFWNLKIIKEDIYIIAEKKKSFFMIKLTSHLHHYHTFVKRHLNFCIRMKSEKLMSVRQSIFFEIKTLLCNDPNKCDQKKDLSESKKNFKWIIYLMDFMKVSLNDSIIFQKEDIFSLDDDQKIIWNFDVLEFKEYNECDIFLEKKFFEQYYLTIVNDLENQFYSLISLKKYDYNLFDQKTSFLTFSITINIIIMIVVFCFILISYIWVERKIKRIPTKKLEKQINKRRISENNKIKKNLLKNLV